MEQDDKQSIDFNNKLRDDKIVHNGMIVEDGIHSEFWQEIIGPEIYKMITRTGSFQKPDGSWVAGHWARPSTDINTRTYCAGYQAGLMELTNAILSFVKVKDDVISERSKQKVEETNQELVHPMAEEYE